MAVSGSGNVAVYTVEKLLELGAIPLTVSDSTGYVYFEDGITTDILESINDHKVIKRGRLADYKKGEQTHAPTQIQLHNAEICCDFSAVLRTP